MSYYSVISPARENSEECGCQRKLVPHGNIYEKTVPDQGELSGERLVRCNTPRLPVDGDPWRILPSNRLVTPTSHATVIDIEFIFF